MEPVALGRGGVDVVERVIEPRGHERGHLGGVAAVAAEAVAEPGERDEPDRDEGDRGEGSEGLLHGGSPLPGASRGHGPPGMGGSDDRRMAVARLRGLSGA